MEQFELIAKTFQGLEEVLAQELTELGADEIQIGRRMVSFTGNKEMMYRANFCLRTAVRILKPIKHFTASDANDVYTAVRAIDWSQYLDLNTTFAVDSVVYSTEFRHSKFVAYKVKDAIVDYFRETTGERPNIRISKPDIQLNIHIAEDQCTLSLDSSGESLHLRGYRTGQGEAPINEVLAAGLIKLTGWQCDTDFIDPFCGSGTILVEAALMARNIYPGVFRKNFGFEKWKDFDADLLESIYNDDSEEREFVHHIYGYDLNLRAVEIARDNAKSAGVSDIVSVEQRDIANFVQPAEKSLMVTNPPYGERITSPDLLGLYRTFGRVLKHDFTGGEAWVISYKEECFANMGLKPSFKVPLYNGSLDCEFRKYQLFDGKLDAFRAAGGDVKTNEERRRMAETGRFKKRRDEFKGRTADSETQEREKPDFTALDEEQIQAYKILRRKHSEFELRNGRVEQRDERGDRRKGRPYRDDKRLKGDDKRFKGDDKRFKGDDKRFKGGRAGHADRNRRNDRRDD